jgi:Ca2+-binding RTX toxin-like protein
VAKQATRTASLSLEPLTDRIVPSTDLSNGEIYIYGGNGPDTVTVTAEFVQSGSYTDSVATIVGGRVTTKYASELGYYEVKVVENETTTLQIPLNQVTGRVIFYGFGGDDDFRNFTSLRTYANGMEDNDILIGGWGNDTLLGGNGLDSMLGQHGNDEIYDQGTDSISNYIEGGYGDDVLYGGNGSDTIDGGNGIDTLAGLDGNDTLLGGNGTDYLFGHAGDDTLDAGTDTTWNYLEGGADNDTMYGANGWDYMYGQGGSDTLYGRDGTDYLDGGNDMIHDRLYGGAGNDFFQEDWVQAYGGWGNIDEARDWHPGDQYYDA